MIHPKTNLDHWALMPAGIAGLRDEYTLELGDKRDDGYDVTFVVPAELEWQTAKLIMYLLSNLPVAGARLTIHKDRESVRVTTLYPGYMADPTADYTY